MVLSRARWIGGLAAALLVPVLSSARAQQPAAPEVIMAVPAVGFVFAATYIAEDLELWAKHGVRVKSIPVAGVGSINAVISGSADFAETSGASLARAAARGQRLLAIANLFNHPAAQVVLRKDITQAAGFDRAASLVQRSLALKDRTIAIGSINGQIHAYVRLLALRAGFDPESIRVALMAPSTMVAALEASKVDGFAATPPWPVISVANGKAVMVASGPDGDPPDMIPYATTVMVTLPSTCETRKSICRGIGQALAEAARFLRDHPDKALALLQRRFSKLSGDAVAASFAAARKSTPVPPSVTEQDLSNAESFDVNAGLLKPEERLKSYNGLFTDEYVR